MTSDNHTDSTSWTITALASALNQLLDTMPPSKECREAAECMEALLVSLVAHMPPRQELGEELLSTGRVRIARALLEHQPTVCRCFAMTDQLKARDWLGRAEDDFLTLALESLPARPFEEEDLLSEMIRRDLRDHVCRALAGRDPSAPFTDITGAHAMNIIEWCGPALAPEIARRLSAALAAGTETARGFETELYSNADLKVMAVLLRAGVDLSNADCFDSIERHPLLAEIIALGTSAHGRMQMAARERSLEAMLARPKEGVFFDLQVDEEAQTIRRVVPRTTNLAPGPKTVETR